MTGVRLPHLQRLSNVRFTLRGLTIRPWLAAQRPDDGRLPLHFNVQTDAYGLFT